MKKVVVIVLAAALIFCLAACSAPAEQSEAPAETAGGWTIRTENGMTMMTEESATAWTGGFISSPDIAGDEGYEPIALLGTQVVAGTNYMFLARRFMDENAEHELCTVVIYEDLEGNDKILSITPFDLASKLDSEGTDSEQGLAGGYTVNEEIDKTACLTDDETAAFEKATEGLAGVGYTPVTVLASQVVAGENLAYLAKGVTVTAEPVTNLYIVNVYKDLEDGASINNICVLNLAELTE